MASSERNERSNLMPVKKVRDQQAYKTAKQSAIDKVLGSETESPPEYPAQWLKHYQAQLGILADEISLIDGQIQTVNEQLHRAQGVKAGKVSVKFIQVRGKRESMHGRVPCPVRWWAFGKGKAGFYSRIPRKQRLGGMAAKVEFNRKAVRLLLRHLQILLEKRDELNATAVAFGKAAQGYKRGAKRLADRTNQIVAEAGRALEHDYTKAR